MPLATITEAKYTEAVLNEDVEPKSNDEADVVSEGVLEGEINPSLIEALSARRKWEQGDVPVENRPVQVMKGVMITLKLNGSGDETYQRFLSEEWIRQYLQERTGKRCPPLLKADLECFAGQLAARSLPIRIEAFDSSVDLEKIKVYESVDKAPSEPINENN